MSTLQKKNKKTGQKFCGFVGRSRARKLSASGASPPNSPSGALSLDPAGGSVLRPPLALAPRARHGLRSIPQTKTSGSAPELNCTTVVAFKRESFSRVTLCYDVTYFLSDWGKHQCSSATHKEEEECYFNRLKP